MKIIKNKSDLLDYLDVLQSRAADAGSAVERDVRAILTAVKENGDSSVMKFTRKFDDKNAREITLGAAEINKIARKARPEIVKARKERRGG